MREAFGIPDDHDPVGVITIGHREGGERPSRLAAHPRAPRRSTSSCTAAAGASGSIESATGGSHRGSWPAARRGLGMTEAAGRPQRAGPRAVAKLQALVRIPTVSYREPERVDTAAFDEFVDELARQFPLLHERLELTRVHTHGLLFHWRGASAERPVVLMAHLDVVPVEGTWQHDAFSGAVVDGQIWGRGTLDDKGCLVGDLRGGRDPARAGLHARAGRVAVVRLRRGGVRYGGRDRRRRARSAAACGRGSWSTRAARSRTTRSPASASRSASSG